MIIEENYQVDRKVLLLLSEEFDISPSFHAQLWDLLCKQAENKNFSSQLWVNEHGFQAITDFYDGLFSKLIDFKDRGPTAGLMYQWIFSLILDSFLHIRKEAILLLEPSSRSDLTRIERTAVIFLHVLRMAYPHGVFVGRLHFSFDGFQVPAISEIERFACACEHLNITGKPALEKEMLVDAMLDYGMRIAESPYFEDGNFPETYSKFARFVVSLSHVAM